MNKWYNDINVLSAISTLRQASYSWKEVCDKLISLFPNYKFKDVESVRKRFGENQDKAIRIPQLYTFEEAYDRFCEFVNKTVKHKPPKANKKGHKKILVISDTHIPFHNQELLVKTVEQHKDADICLVAGDFMDCYSVSRFSKKHNIPLSKEIEQATLVMEYLASTFPEVIILEGNHTDRVRKYFEARIDASLMFLVQYDILEMMAHSYDNVRISNDHYLFPNGNGEADIGYFTIIGKDFVVGHFERSSVIPVRAVQYSYEWLSSWQRLFKIDEIRLFLQGHTHRLSKYPLNSGIPIIGETGCLCKVQEYTIGAGATYKAHLCGYWVVYQNKGKTDLNNSNFVLYEC